MYVLTGNIRSIYFRYLLATFGSACIPCIYNLVDMAIVGQYYGSDGTAALSVVMPLFSIIYSLGILTGIGGSVLYSTEKGKQSQEDPNAYFTVSVICTALLSVLAWILLFTVEEPLLRFFGADDDLITLAMEYMAPIRIAIPLFIFNQMLATYLRNDNAPICATVAVVISGACNVLGDLLFVFGLDMGMLGAGIATAIGALISMCIMLLHFHSKKNTLHFTKISHFWQKAGRIALTGFPSFFVDLALGIVTVLFNRQIMQYLGTDALSVFGVLTNLNTFVQCCAYSVGDASQPLLSANFGAKQWNRVIESLRYAVWTVIGFGIIWTGLILLFPNGFIHLFMDATEDVLEIAPRIMRIYSLSFLFMPFNVFSTLYFQSIMHATTAFVVSVGRGLVLSGLCILLLPQIFSADAIWWSMPITEFVTAIYAGIMMFYYTKQIRLKENLKN